MEQASNYCQTKLKPRITKAFREHNSCPEILKEMGEMGLIGCTYKEYDLPGVSSVAFGNHLPFELVASFFRAPDAN